MTPDQIATFLDLADSRSFHATADRLGITQSTVSARIAALEGALGIALFTRSRAGAHLTTAGLKFAPHARALRHTMTEAARAVAPAGEAALTLRIGIQTDLAATRLGDWVTALARDLPACAFYIEPDFSAQMCADLVTGTLDFAVLYTPHPAPDLHFTTLGEARHVLVAHGVRRMADLTPATLIRANYAPAFAVQQATVLPRIGEAPFASGQSAAVVALLMALGGAAYVPEETARTLPAPFVRVTDAPVIGQPVHAATHLRHRTQPMHRTLLRLMQRQFASR
jgi:LysR family transcriptional regulator, flagellar master operon regulator